VGGRCGAGGSVRCRGLFKLTGDNQALAERGMAWAEDFSPAAVKLIGLAEVAGAVGVIVPALVHIAPVLVPLAAACLAVAMVGAVIVDLRRAEAAASLPAVVLLLLAVFAAWGRFGPSPL
jgi:DoxX-like family